MRSAFQPSMMWRKPMPSSPTRFSAGTSTFSKKRMLVWWLIIMSSGLTSSLPLMSRRSTRKTDRPLRLVLELVVRRGAREQQHQVGLLHARDEDLLAVDDVFVALLHRAGFDLRRLRAGVGLGDAEGLEPQFAARDLGQIAPLLLLAAVLEQRAHRVHLGVAGERIAGRAVDLLQDDAGLGDAETGAAILFGDQRAEIAARRQRIDKGLRIFAGLVDVAPIGIGEARADLADRIADRLTVFLARVHHLSLSSGPPARG